MLPKTSAYVKRYSLRAGNSHLGPIFTQDIDHFKG